jgi:hypothetical protein
MAVKKRFDFWNPHELDKVHKNWIQMRYMFCDFLLQMAGQKTKQNASTNGWSKIFVKTQNEARQKSAILFTPSCL